MNNQQIDDDIDSAVLAYVSNFTRREIDSKFYRDQVVELENAVRLSIQSTIGRWFFDKTGRSIGDFKK